MKRIAVIGTGIMGNRIATNFLKHGYEVFVWNRSKNRLKTLIKNSAIPLSTPNQLQKKLRKKRILFLKSRQMMNLLVLSGMVMMEYMPEQILKKY